MLNRRKLCNGATAVLGVSVAGTVRSQSLAGTITLIVVVPPGATMDNVTRLVAEGVRTANTRID
jgi:tripartite-type tricarboxylate transporter receptor subunit TctC